MRRLGGFTMFRYLPAILGLVAVVATTTPHAAVAEAPRVKLATSSGDVVLELAADQAPATVANFVQYVKDGFYDGTIFHRVIANFMIQGGGFTPEFEKKSTREPIPNEADNGLRNQRGSIAMARTGEPHSATAQFFINVVDNPNLDHKAKNPRGWGYAVFGRVVDGMDVVDSIRNVQTGNRGSYRNVPREPVIIRSATLMEGAQ
jgi:cyclophilin family peptidyl-prolyl cis-trans isomerase